MLFRVTMSRGFRFCRTASTSTLADALALATISSWTLAMCSSRAGSCRDASIAELMVLAVYMPPHEPEPGMPALDLPSRARSVPAVNWPTASNTLTMLRSLPW
jgi:hypothetical protein